MVDLGEIQAAYYMVAATGVLVAAIYYVYNMREQRRNRRITLTQSLIQSFSSPETFRIQGELMNMEWSDYDDFEKKYGSDYNVDNYAKRMYIFYYFEALGDLLKAGLADAETLYSVIWLVPITVWMKFLPTITENRKRYTGKDGWSGFEYLVNRMLEIKRQHDPGYVVPDALTRYVPNK
jgi:hypothetical protein